MKTSAVILLYLFGLGLCYGATVGLGYYLYISWSQYWCEDICLIALPLVNGIQVLCSGRVLTLPWKLKEGFTDPSIRILFRDDTRTCDIQLANDFEYQIKSVEMMRQSSLMLFGTAIGGSIILTFFFLRKVYRLCKGYEALA